MIESILVLDFGGQYNQLIARRVRECNVYCEVRPYTATVEEIKEMNPKGIILTGGPNSVYDMESPHADPAIFELGIPVLGICYGAQLMAWTLGGKVATAPVSEYGKTEVTVCGKEGLLKDVGDTSIVWMSHTDYIEKVPEGFEITAYTPVCPVAAMENREKKLYAFQYHPEPTHSKDGLKMLAAFVHGVCGCKNEWKVEKFVPDEIEEIRNKVGDAKVICGLSGGADSSVAAVLLAKAIGKQLTCVFVDHGLMRKDEGDEVEAIFGADGDYHLNFVRVNAQQRFYDKLAGVEDPEKKRKIIGEEFIRIFEEEAEKIGGAAYLAQGTIYSDVIESGTGVSALIKSHHNVGGLPEHIEFEEIIEPLRTLFKDEVQALGIKLGIPEHLVYRQAFPGPGLGIRIVGEVTEQKVKIVQEADAIFREEIEKAGLEKEIDQYFAALTDMRSVGVMGDFRTYDYTVALRAITTTDFMTAEAARLPWDLIEKVTSRIINEVDHVNRVFYDCTSKPPATIEFE